jgi:hypothetical protein
MPILPWLYMIDTATDVFIIVAEKRGEVKKENLLISRHVEYLLRGKIKEEAVYAA